MYSNGNTAKACEPTQLSFAVPPYLGASLIGIGLGVFFLGCSASSPTTAAQPAPSADSSVPENDTSDTGGDAEATTNTGGTPAATGGSDSNGVADGTGGDTAGTGGMTTDQAEGTGGTNDGTGGADENDSAPMPVAGGSIFNSELCGGTASAEPDFSLLGWATVDGATTGGQGGTTVTVSNAAELVAALSAAQDSGEPTTILVAGTISPADTSESKIDLKDIQDISIIGLGDGADFDGIGIKVTRASNIVLRNLKIHNVLTGDKDAISIEGPADHIWVDHCELYAELDGVDKDLYDGLLDAKRDSAYITYSWNYLHDSWKAMLVGSSDGDLDDRKITMHHNRIDHVNSRLPLFRAGQAHIFNNDYNDVLSTAINTRMGACIRIEQNVFSLVQNPWISAYSDELGSAELRCNLVSDDSVFDEPTDESQAPLACALDVPYDYASQLHAPEDVRTIVHAYSGVGKLEDPTDF